MEFGAVLHKRRMVRRFTGEPITPEQADRVASAALRAPTAGNSQGIAVVSVTDPALIRAVADACGEPAYVERGFDPWLSRAGQHLVICVEPERYRERYTAGDKDPTVLDQIPWWWVDGGAALMASLLAAVDEGLAAGFLGGHRVGEVGRLLGVPDDVPVLGLVAIGHPAPDRRSSSLGRPRRTDAIRYDRWE